MPRLRRVHGRLRFSPCMLVNPKQCPSASEPMAVCVCVRVCSTKRKRVFRLYETTDCVYAHACVRQCPCL
eukprot:11203746-Lingulodinium_polyedra.AAC.1